MHNFIRNISIDLSSLKFEGKKTKTVHMKGENRERLYRASWCGNDGTIPWVRLGWIHCETYQLGCITKLM